MRLIEITEDNTAILELLEMRTDYSEEFNNIIATLTMYDKLKSKQPNQHLLVGYKLNINKQFASFEALIDKFISNENLDIDNDYDLQKYINSAKSQLEKIKRMKEDLGL